MALATICGRHQYRLAPGVAAAAGGRRAGAAHFRLKDVASLRRGGGAHRERRRLRTLNTRFFMNGFFLLIYFCWEFPGNGTRASGTTTETHGNRQLPILRLAVGAGSKRPGVSLTWLFSVRWTRFSRVRLWTDGTGDVWMSPQSGGNEGWSLTRRWYFSPLLPRWAFFII